MSGVRQLALALLTLSRDGWRSLDAPQQNMPSNGRREGERKRIQKDRTETNRKRNNGQTEKGFSKKVWLHSKMLKLKHDWKG